MTDNEQKARHRLERAIRKAWLVRPPGLPQLTLDPNVPLRIQVAPLPGLRIEGRAWLDAPVLHWETSEIECLWSPWTPAGNRLRQRLKLSVERALRFGVPILSAYGVAITHRPKILRKATLSRPWTSAGQKPDISQTRFTVINRGPFSSEGQSGNFLFGLLAAFEPSWKAAWPSFVRASCFSLCRSCAVRWLPRQRSPLCTSATSSTL